MGLNQNTWKLNQWYDQDVAGNVSYSTTEYQLWSWGYNRWGQLGQNQSEAGANPAKYGSYSSPVQVGSGNDWSTDFDVSSMKIVARKNDGTLWAMGRNNYGQLGQGNKTDRSSPVQIGSGTDWKDISSAMYWAMGTKTDGTMWAWGRNNKGQLGQNNTSESPAPVQIPGTDWDKPMHNNMGYGTEPPVAAIKTDGTLWTWGYNYYGGLGLNNRTDYSSPVQIPGTTWSTISFGTGWAAAIKTDNTLWTWGDNSYGTLGHNNGSSNARLSSPVQVPGSWSQASTDRMQGIGGVKTDGTAWMWGYNANGNLGQNNVVHYSSPAQIGSGTDWSKLEVGDLNALGLKTDNTLWSWGYSEYGTTGINSKVKYSSPVQIPGTTWTDMRVGFYNAGGIKEV